MRICIIGPTYPFRGGISHYTTLLYRYLRKRHDVRFYAFKRQYPKWIFPGRTDKDNSKRTIREDGVVYLLDSINPLSWLEVFRRIRRADPDMVIIPWWVSFWTPQFWVIVSLLKKQTRTKILFICHNVVEHESNFIFRCFTKFVLKYGDWFIVHSNEDYENLKQIIPQADVTQSYHPSYDVFHSGAVPKEEARKYLGIEGDTILFFGFVRPYKGLKYLIAATAKIVKTLNVTLLIVGEFWKGEDEYQTLIEGFGIQGNVKIINKYVPNEDVEVYFSASDLVILPYVSASGSGIVQIAFGCNKPVISTNVGCLSEVIDHGKTGFLVPPRDSNAIVDAVVSFYRDEKNEEFVRNIENDRKKFSWERMVEAIEKYNES